MHNKLAQFPEISPAPSQSMPGVIIATVQGVSPEGRPLVQWPAGEKATDPRAAQTAWMEREPDWPAYVGKRVIIGFENGHPAQPILLGLLDKPALPSDDTGHPPAEINATEPDMPDTLRIESTRELVLECGKARISLRADGRIIILGGYVVSRSTGVNKIKGGSVQVN